MNILKYIALHHSGGLKNNAYASTQHLTFENINAAHKARWPHFKSSLGFNGGYNCIYDPKTRKFHQYRALGEETAAQIGYNKNTLSLCIIGNYMLHNGSSVDKLSVENVEDIKEFLIGVLKGTHQLKTISGTVLEFSVSRIHPHRFYQKTECYGTSLSDDWIQSLVRDEVQEQIKIFQNIVDYLFEQIQTLKRVSMGSLKLGGAEDLECCGFID